MVIGKPNPPSTQLLFQDAVFFDKVIDDLGLLAIHPARERREKELKAEVVTCHARSLRRRKSSSDRVVEFSDTTGDALFAHVYTALKTLAKRQMSGERADHTLQASALVSEVWLRLRDQVDEARENPGRFYIAAAESMRRILIEHARSRGRIKRGGDLRKLSLNLVRVAASTDLDQVLAIDAAIEGLEAISSRAASLVRLRFFAGLTEVEAANALEISRRSAWREWAFARAWLFQALTD